MKVKYSTLDNNKIIVCMNRRDRAPNSDEEFWNQLRKVLSDLGIPCVKSTPQQDGVITYDAYRIHLRDLARTFRIYALRAGDIASLYKEKRKVYLGIEDLTFAGDPPKIGEAY